MFAYFKAIFVSWSKSATFKKELIVYIQLHILDVQSLWISGTNLIMHIKEKHTPLNRHN